MSVHIRLQRNRESGKRDSNPRPQPWQGCALPTELFPQERAEPFRTATSLRTCSEPASSPCGRGAREVHGDGGEGDRTPDLVNAIQALSQLSYAPSRQPHAVRTKAGHLEPRSIALCIWRVNETGPSEIVCGQYFAAPSRVVADLRWLPQILSDRGLSTVEMRRCIRNRRRS